MQQPGSPATATVQQQQQQGAASPALVKLCDLRPSASTTVNTTFIMLEKGQPTGLSGGGPMVCVAMVADATASVHLQLWGNECDAFQPSDIIRLSNGLFSNHKNNMVLRAGKKGSMEKIGEFTMVFVEVPNMSRLQWIPDPSNSKLWIPVGLPPLGVHAPHGALLSNPNSLFRGFHQERA